MVGDLDDGSAIVRPELLAKGSVGDDKVSSDVERVLLSGEEGETLSVGSAHIAFWLNGTAVMTYPEV